MSVVHTTSVRLPDVQVFNDFGSQLPYTSQWCNNALAKAICAYIASFKGFVI